MTITDTTLPRSRSRKPTRRHKAAARPRRARLYRRIDLRSIAPHTTLAALVDPSALLHVLMDDGDVYKVGHRLYLVALINADILNADRCHWRD